MTILYTLVPLIFALLLGFYWDLKLLTPRIIDSSLKWLTYIMLGLIGYGIGALEQLADKLYTSGVMAIVLFSLIMLANVGALTLSSRYLGLREKKKQVAVGKAKLPMSWSVFSDSILTVVWVLGGALAGYFSEGYFSAAEESVAWLLYLLMFMIGRQLHQANYRLRSLFLNTQGLIISAVVLVSTLAAAAFAGWLLNMPIFSALAVASGFGWYSLSGILITDLGNPVLGTTAFLLDIAREVVALMMIPVLSRLGSHCTVGVSGATAMDFTLPMLGKFHGAGIIPTAIASGFVLSLLVPVLIPLFLSFS